MAIPGSNLLVEALGVIASQTVSYIRYAARAPNAIGQYITTYAAAESVQGSFQPVPRSLYQQQGLDYQKSYWNFYVPNAVIDVTRDVSGDQLSFQGRKYQCESVTPWYSIDGWNAVLCVDVGPAA